MKSPFSTMAIGLSMVFCAGVSALHAANARAEETAGRVQGVYFESARGVLTERAVTAANPDVRRWADVEVRAADGGSRRALVVVPQGVDAHVGDWVEVSLAPGPFSLDVAPLTRLSQITVVHPSVLVGDRRSDRLPGEAAR